MTTTRRGISRRQLLVGGAAAALAAPFLRWRSRAEALPPGGTTRRFIVFYFPDGVPGPSAQGMPSLWHPTGGETSFALPDVLSPLQPFKDACTFFRGLSMGSADAGSHPGGAKKLLTGVPGGNGQSIDQYLAGTVGADRPFRHLYLGAMSTQGASADKFISYLGAGQTATPDDDPAHAFQRLFGAGVPGGGGGGGGGGGTPPPARVARAGTVIDAAKADLDDLRGSLGAAEKARLDLHLESLREVEARVDQIAGGGGGGDGNPGPVPACAPVAPGGFGGQLYDPAKFPAVLRAQIDVMVQAMACDLTRVGVVQCSGHTSELVMSRFAETELYDPSFDMRSHQASHYGPAHDPTRREFAAFVRQRKWFVAQFAYLLDQLKQRPEGDGTMLDYSAVLLCTEVCDGNTHSHDDMPFVLAGQGGGRLRSGRLLSFDYRRHGDLLAGIGRAMGASIGGWGEDSGGPLPGLLNG